MTRDDLGAVRAAVRRAADAGAARERDRLYAAIGRLAAEPLFAKADDPPAAPAPAPAPQPGGHVPPALMLAMVDHALECREWGDDPEPGLAALRKLVDDPRAMARVLGESRVVTKAAWAALTKAWTPPPAGTPAAGGGDAAARREGQVWQGPSGKWFTLKNGRVQWAPADMIPGAGSVASAASVGRAAGATRPQSTARPLAGAKSDAELEAMSPADRKRHADERVAALTKKVQAAGLGKGGVTAADLHELGKHLGQLTHGQLRSLRSTLQGSLGGHHGAFGAQRTHAGRVHSLQDHLGKVADARAKLADHARTASAAAKAVGESPAPKEGAVLDPTKAPAKPAVPASPLEAEAEAEAAKTTPAKGKTSPGKLPENGPVEIPDEGGKAKLAKPAKPAPAAARSGAGLPENGPVELGPKAKPVGKAKPAKPAPAPGAKLPVGSAPAGVSEPAKLPVASASSSEAAASGIEKDKPGAMPDPLHALAAAAHAGPGELLRVASEARAAATKTVAAGGHLATHDAITAAERGDHGPAAKAAVRAGTAWENHEGNIDRKYMAVGRELAKAGFGKPAANGPPPDGPVDPDKEAFVRGEKPAPLHPEPDGGGAPAPSPDAPVPGKRPEPAETEADRVPWDVPVPGKRPEPQPEPVAGSYRRGGIADPNPKAASKPATGATAKDRQMAGVLARSVDPQMRAVAEHIRAGLPFGEAHAKVFGVEPESTAPPTYTTPGPGTPPPPPKPKPPARKGHDEGRVGRIVAAARAGTHGPALTANFVGASEADMHEAARRMGVHDTLPNKASEAGNIHDEAKRYAASAGSAKDSYRRAADKHRADAGDADRLPGDKVPPPATGPGWEEVPDAKWEVVPDDEAKRKPAKPTDGLNPLAPKPVPARPDTAVGGANALIPGAADDATEHGKPKPTVPPRPPLPTRPKPKGEPAPGDDMGRKATGPKPGKQPARPAAHSEAHARLRSAIDSSAGLSDDQRAKYHAALDRVAGAMPGAAHARAHEHVADATFHPDGAAVLAAISHRLSPDHLRDLQARKVAVGGAYDKTSGTLHADGDRTAEHAGRHGAGTNTAHHVYAHELGHAIDGPGEELSTSAAWRQAFAGEIDHAHNPLTQYARKSASEGFAEFARLVYASDVPHAQVEKEFPKATAFFKDRGLWPDKERTGPEDKMPEQFTDRVPLAGGAHADATDPAKLSQSNPQVADKKQVADAIGKIAGQPPDAPHYAPDRVRAMAEQARRVAGSAIAPGATPEPRPEPRTAAERLARLDEPGVVREDVIAAAGKVGGPELAAAVKKLRKRSEQIALIRDHLAGHPEPDAVKFSMSDEEEHPEQVFARPDVREGIPVREHDPAKDPPHEHPDAVRAAAHDKARAAGHDPADLDREAVRVAWENHNDHPNFKPGRHAGFHVPTAVRNAYTEAHERLDDRRDAAAVGATRPEDVLAHLEATAGVRVEGVNSPHLTDGRAADAARKARAAGLDPAEVGAAAARHAARIAREHGGTVHRGQVAQLAYLAAHDEVAGAKKRRDDADLAARAAAARVAHAAVVKEDTTRFADAYFDRDDAVERAREYVKASAGDHDDYHAIDEEHLDDDTRGEIGHDLRRLPPHELTTHLARAAGMSQPGHPMYDMAHEAISGLPDVPQEDFAPATSEDARRDYHVITDEDTVFDAARAAAAKLPGAARAFGLGDGAVLIRDGSPLHRALAAGLGDDHKWGGLADDSRMADLFGSLKSGRQVPQSAVPASAKNYGTTAGALNPDVVEDDDWNPQAVDVYRRLTPDLYVRRKSDGTAEDDHQFDIVHRRDVPPLSNLPDAYWADFDHAPNHDADIETREQQRQAKEVPDNVETFRDRSGSVVNRMHQDATGEFLTTRSLTSMKEAIADHRRRVNAARQAWHAALAGVPDGDRPEEPDWHDVDASALEESYDSRREHFDALDKLNSAYWTHADEAEAAVDEAKAVATAYHRKHSLRGVRTAAEGMSPARRARIALDALGLPHKHLTDEQAAAFHDQMQALHARFAPKS